MFFPLPPTCNAFSRTPYWWEARRPLVDHMGKAAVVEALRHFDRLYPQPNEESALQQLQIQLANPLPYDLEDMNLVEYKHLDRRWHDWRAVKAVCVDSATLIFDRITGLGR